MQASFQTERRCPCVSNHEPRFEARVSRARFACRPHRSCCNNQELVIACDPGGALRNESSSLVPLANERALAASRFRRHQLRKPMQPLTFLPSIFLAEEDAEHAGNCCTKAKVWFLFLNFLNFPSEFFLPYNAISQLDLSQRENRTLLISVFFFFLNKSLIPFCLPIELVYQLSKSNLAHSLDRIWGAFFVLWHQK